MWRETVRFPPSLSVILSLTIAAVSFGFGVSLLSTSHPSGLKSLVKLYFHDLFHLRTDPIVAAGMNKSEKIVFSRTLQKADWNNTRLVKADMLAEVRRLKQGAGKDLMVLGSGSILAQLAEEGLMDE